MRTFNVHVGVVELIDAVNEDQAIKILVERLERAGFDVYSEGRDAFESEAL